MNCYEFNKMAYRGVPPMKNEVVFKLVGDYLVDNPSTFYMMLNHDTHYFTLFHVTSNDMRHVASEMIDIATNLGDVVDVNLNNTKDMLEIWIRKNEQVIMYGLFNYERGVVEV